MHEACIESILQSKVNLSSLYYYIPRLTRAYSLFDHNGCYSFQDVVYHPVISFETARVGVIFTVCILHRRTSEENTLSDHEGK